MLYDGNMKKVMRNKLKYEEKIKRNILKGVFDMTSLLFGFLMDMGEMTIETFLNPSLYADLPTGMYRFSLEDKRPKEVTIRQTISRMEKHGFIKKENGVYKLSSVGKYLAQCILKRKKIFEKKWDKKYRVVIFDIPEKKKQSRNWLRDELYELKYKKLQKSVFIGKFPLPDDLVKSIKIKKIDKYVDYLLAEKIYSKLEK
jgi:CRISPR-associated endonuclease Cas2